MNDFKIENSVLIEYTGAETCVVIPEGVTEIGDATFSCRERLRSISIPESVTHIGDDAFDECCSLKVVHLPSALRKIGRGAFRTCERLKEINLPSELKEIGEGAFYGCSSLKNVLLPDGLLSIASMAFADCYSLKSIAIPDSVASLGCSIFTGEDKNLPPREDENDDDFDECDDDEDRYIFMEYGSLGLSSLKIPSALAGKLDQLFYQDTRPCFVYVDDISSVSPSFRMLALMGFVEHEQEYSPETRAGYFRYIRANAEDLRKEAANRPALLKLLHREKLISSSDVTKILQCIIWRSPWRLENILQEKTIDAEKISLIYAGLKNCNRYKKACRQLEAYAAENGLDISKCETIEFIIANEEWNAFIRKLRQRGMYVRSKYAEMDLDALPPGTSLSADSTVYLGNSVHLDHSPAGYDGVMLGEMEPCKNAGAREVNAVLTELCASVIRSAIASQELELLRTEFLKAFYLRQIRWFTEMAISANSTACAAVLMNYQNEHFPDHEDEMP